MIGHAGRLSEAWGGADDLDLFRRAALTVFYRFLVPLSPGAVSLSSERGYVAMIFAKSLSFGLIAIKIIDPF